MIQLRYHLPKVVMKNIVTQLTSCLNNCLMYASFKKKCVFYFMLQMHRGQLKEGSLVAIRSVKLTKSCRTRDFMQHIEMISKFRHHHLVSVLGHCFEHYLDDSNVRRIFIVFEYVPNGSLKTWISGTLS